MRTIISASLVLLLLAAVVNAALPVKWNISIGSSVGVHPGWGYLYVTTSNLTLNVYDESSGTLLNSSEIGDQMCSIWSGQSPVRPLMQKEMAVVAESNAVTGFFGTSVANVGWTSPANFTCTSVLHVARNGKAVVIDNSTVMGVVSAETGQFLWYWRYTNYNNYSSQATTFTFIDVASTGEFFILILNMPSNEDPTSATLRDGLTGDIVWTEKSTRFAYYTYDPIHDLLIYQNQQFNCLSARKWREGWDNSKNRLPVWNVTFTSLWYGGFQIIEGVVLVEGASSIIAVEGSKGQILWSYNTSSTKTKQQAFTRIGDDLYYSFSLYPSADYMPVVMQQLDWRTGVLKRQWPVASVLYGWFRQFASEDSTALFLLPHVQSVQWLVSVDVSKTVSS
jgi:hypothetical protein